MTLAHKLFLSKLTIPAGNIEVERFYNKASSKPALCRRRLRIRNLLQDAAYGLHRNSAMTQSHTNLKECKVIYEFIVKSKDLSASVPN